MKAMIKIIINLVEALIASYGLSQLCHVKYKNIYFVLNTLITLIIEVVCDYFNANYVPLTVSYIIFWYILLLFFTKKEYIYNLFVCIFNEVLITFSAMILKIFIGQYNFLLAVIGAKILHLVFTVLFVKYQHRYQYFAKRYWALIMMILIACILILNLQGRIILQGQYTLKNICTIILCMLIVVLSLHFFYLLEETSKEKEKITKELEERKYQNMTYDIMERTKDELYRLEHSLTYYMLLIKNHLEKENKEEVFQVIDSYMEKVENTNFVVYTGNELFDFSMTTYLRHQSSKVDMCIMISKDGFYNSMQFIKFMISLLDMVDAKKINLLIKEERYVKLIQISGNNCFINQNSLEDIIQDIDEFECCYQIDEEEGLHTLKIKIIEHF